MCWRRKNTRPRSHLALTQLCDEHNIFIAKCDFKIAGCVVREIMHVPWQIHDVWCLSKAAHQCKIRPFKATIELKLHNLTMLWSSPHHSVWRLIIPGAHALVTDERNDLWLGIPTVLPLINNSKATPRIILRCYCIFAHLSVTNSTMQYFIPNNIYFLNFGLLLTFDQLIIFMSTFVFSFILLYHSVVPTQVCKFNQLNFNILFNI